MSDEQVAAVEQDNSIVDVSSPATTTPEVLSIVDLDGNGRTLKMKLAWGKERKLLKIVGELFASIPSEVTFGIKSSDNPGLALLEYLTKEAPEKLTQIVALLLDISEDDVDNKYDGDAIMEFAIPFITSYATRWGERLKGLPINQFFGTGNV